MEEKDKTVDLGFVQGIATPISSEILSSRSYFMSSLRNIGDMFTRWKYI